LQEASLALAVIGTLFSLFTILYLVFRNSKQDTTQYEQRITALETKVGLFWHLIEDNLSGAIAKANPIHLTDDEKEAAKVYETLKSKAPDTVLTMLDAALEREVPKGYMSADEKLLFTLVHSAIRAQLFDRGLYKAA